MLWTFVIICLIFSAGVLWESGGRPGHNAVRSRWFKWCGTSYLEVLLALLLVEMTDRAIREYELRKELDQDG